MAEHETAGNEPASKSPEELAIEASKSQCDEQMVKVSEYTQAVIALIIVIPTAAGVFIGRVIQQEAQVPFPAEWWTIIGLVIGFYFGRTRSTRTTNEG